MRMTRIIIPGMTKMQRMTIMMHIREWLMVFIQKSSSFICVLMEYFFETYLDIDGEPSALSIISKWRRRSYGTKS